MSEESKRGVVIHLDEADPVKHTAVFRNAGNLLEEFGDSAGIELVVHGPGLSAVLKDGANADDVTALLRRGLVVAACENTMRRESITADQLVPNVITVSAGLAELARRQWEGWAYVRP